MRLKDLGEIELVKRLSKRISKRISVDKSVIKGIGDDAAVLRWTRTKHLLFTCDMLIEDVHFKLKTATSYQIGWKALGRNISDIAAMGGLPRYALVSIGISPNLSTFFLDGIYNGMADLAKTFKINMVGGDMTRSDKLVIDVSLIGEVERNNLVLRSGARIGDVILITGSIGGSIKGKHLKFIPRLNEARMLVKYFKINSMIDISDGLALDLWRILDASKVGALIYENTIPLSKEADSFEKASFEGEDFELLFTMTREEARRFFKTRLAKMDTPVTLIGEIVDKDQGCNLIRNDGRMRTLKAKGYTHF